MNCFLRTKLDEVDAGSFNVSRKTSRRYLEDWLRPAESDWQTRNHWAEQLSLSTTGRLELKRSRSQVELSSRSLQSHCEQVVSHLTPPPLVPERGHAPASRQ